MKITSVFFGLSLCLALLPYGTRADKGNSPVTYAEASFGCQGLSPDLGISPAINIRAEDVEVRIQGSGATLFSLDGNEVVFRAPDGHKLIIGTLTSAPSCTVFDTGESATANWNPITLSQGVLLSLNQGAPYTLTVTDLSTQKNYQLSW